MGSKGVQFRGCEPLIRAYDNCKIIAWAVLYDKNINCKYIGDSEQQAREQLNAFLELLAQSGSTSVYTLNLYEDLPKGAKIKPSTEPDYSFNFTLFDDEYALSPYGTRRKEQNRLLEDRITQLEAQIAARKLEDEDEDDSDREAGIGGVINGILESDRFKNWIQEKAFFFADKLFDKPGTVVPMNTQPARVGAITEESPVLIDEAQQTKAAQAIEVLARVDAHLGDNLLKIAEIARTDPGKYMMLTKML